MKLPRLLLVLGGIGMLGWVGWYLFDTSKLSTSNSSQYVTEQMVLEKAISPSRDVAVTMFSYLESGTLPFRDGFYLGTITSVDKGGILTVMFVDTQKVVAVSMEEVPINVWMPVLNQGGQTTGWEPTNLTLDTLNDRVATGMEVVVVADVLKGIDKIIELNLKGSS